LASVGADSTSLRGSSIACLCALLMGAACGPGDPAPSNEGSAPAPDAGDEPNCLSVQQMADGSCCGTGMFADVATGQCVPIGPAECRSSVLTDAAACVPLWCLEYRDAKGELCSGTAGQSPACAPRGRRCTDDEVAAGAGCPAGSWPDPSSKNCIGAGADLERQLTGADEQIPPVVAPPGVPPLNKLPPVHETGFCRDNKTGAPRLCQSGEAACKKGHMSDPADQTTCLPVGVTWTCPQAFVIDPVHSDGERFGCRPASAACPTSKWPTGVGPTALHVDASANDGGDGSAKAPFRHISAAVAASKAGDTIAVAAGSYVENVVIDHPLKVLGTCAAQVVVRSTDPEQLATITITSTSSKDTTTLAGLSISGVRDGVAVKGARALLEELEVRLVQGNAVAASTGAEVRLLRAVLQDVQPPAANPSGKESGVAVRIQDAEALLEDVHIDRVKRRGVWVSGDKAAVVATGIRIQRTTTAPGLAAPGLRADKGATLTCRSCAIAESWMYGVYAIGPKTTVKLLGLTVDEVPLDAAPHFGGAGIGARTGAIVELHGVRVASVQGGGLVAHHADTAINGSGLISEGHAMAGKQTGLPKGIEIAFGASASLRSVRISDLHGGIGFFADGAGTKVQLSDVLVDGMAALQIDDPVQPAVEPRSGVGLITSGGASLDVAYARLTNVEGVGATAQAKGHMHLVAVLIDAMAPDGKGRQGTGLAILEQATSMVHGVRIHGGYTAGIDLADGAHLDATGLLVDGVRARQSDKRGGAGLHMTGASSVAMRGSRLTDNRLAGILAADGTNVQVRLAGTGIDGTRGSQLHGGGFGAYVQQAKEAVVALSCRLHDNQASALLFNNTPANVSGSVITATLGNKVKPRGRGGVTGEPFEIADGITAFAGSRVAVEQSVIAGHTRVAILVDGAGASTVDTSMVTKSWIGIARQNKADVAFATSLVHGNDQNLRVEAGLLLPAPPEPVVGD